MSKKTVKFDLKKENNPEKLKIVIKDLLKVNTNLTIENEELKKKFLSLVSETR